MKPRLLLATAFLGVGMAGLIAESAAQEKPAPKRKADKRDEGPHEAGFVVLRLRNAHAVHLARILDEAFNGSQDGRQGPGGGFGKPGGGFGRPAPAAKDRIRVIADPVTNSLLIKASAMDMTTIRKLLDESLDVSDVDSAVPTRTWIIGPLRYRLATDVASVLGGIYRESMGNNRQGEKGAVLSLAVDNRTNSLVLRCTRVLYDDIKVLVDQLEKSAKDTSRPESPPRRVRVIGLKNAKAGDLVKVLREVYQDDRKAVVFSADSRSNRLIVRCPSAMETEINTLVQELDVNGPAVRETKTKGGRQRK
jgi:type II secretory pathway component GspD/PulD (secretin)